jgi:hypothetical protein
LKLTVLACHGAGWRQRRARPTRSLTMRSAPAGLVIEHQEASTVILYLIPAMPERELSLRVEFGLDKLGFAVIRQEACFAVLR